VWQLTRGCGRALYKSRHPEDKEEEGEKEEVAGIGSGGVKNRSMQGTQRGGQAIATAKCKAGETKIKDELGNYRYF
jgi:hypothetical protein